MDVDAQYLYNDGAQWDFMVQANLEQNAMDDLQVAEAKQWLKQKSECILTLWNGAPLAVMAPNFVILKITETDPGVRGDTSGGGGKPAKLETGAVVRVPLFINEGDLLKVDTRKGEYVSRAK